MLMKHIAGEPGDEDQARPPPPQLMHGETSQGFLSARVIPPRIEESSFDETFTPVRLQDLL